MKFILGANYWGSDWATEMWRHYDGAQIRADLKLLAEYGVQNLRVFPNWRDFQPVDKVVSVYGTHGEYVNAHTGEPIYDDGIDMEMIAHFHDFCKAAEENGIELVVSIVTGWMSGKLFFPPVLSGKNLISDPEALMWTRRFVKRFVQELKDEKAIVMWGLGNESNCMGKVNSRYEAYLWTATVVDAIRSEDAVRPISGDMHGLKSDMEDGSWLLQDQGELTDMLCTHPYPSPTVGGDAEPYNRLRTTCVPTAQTLYYAGVSGKPAYIQESGALSQTIGNREMDAQFMRINILSAIANNLNGYQWWCAWDQKNMHIRPYTLSMRELGMFDENKQPKPTAYVSRAMRELLHKLPADFPKRTVDAVCVLSRSQEREKVAQSAVIFGKQAGLDIDIVYTDGDDLPDVKLYLLPCITGWQVLYKKTYYALLEKVKNGATLYISFAGGQIESFPDVVGAQSLGFLNNQSHSIEIGGETLPYNGKEVLLQPTTAQVLLQNEAGNPVMLKNQYGKGIIYFVNIPMENLAFAGTDLFNTMPYYKIYREVAKDIINDKLVMVEDKNIGITINPIDKNECFVTLLNYGDTDIVPNIKIKDGWKISEVFYGNADKIPACDGVFLTCKVI